MQHALQVEILKELMAQLDEGKNVDAGVQYKMPTTSYVCPEMAALERNEFFQVNYLRDKNLFFIFINNWSNFFH